MNKDKITDPARLGLPHRAPFLFVDEVVSSVETGVVVCRKTFNRGESMFVGHFPGNPIVPGVILTEALAQTAGICGARNREGASFLLSAVRMMKFPAAARPGDEIQLRAELRGALANLMTFDVVASVGETVVAEGQIVLSDHGVRAEE